MAFDIVLYKNYSENNKLDKLISDAYTINGVLRDNSSIITPEIEIGYNPTGYNYCYISEFGRYYYINDIVFTNNGLYIIKCNCDVLMSYIDDIKESQVLLENTTITELDNYLHDNYVWRNKVKSFTDIINFTSGLSDTGEYILITAGG